uniref:ribosomal protein L3 n=1 Tax=Catenella fusiformis TaxID=3024791 RepID=UPI0027DA0B03|nr:ribosomal protein L3 [Catenella fusiformis]WCH57560.1 ribosomal protein L3 [Catenella fusiformis]
MSIGLLGTKLGMTQLFNDAGNALPITLLQVGPCMITQIKDTKSHGYEAIQIGYYECNYNKLTKPETGHLNKVGAPSFRYLKEYRVKSIKEFNVGQNITVNQLKIGYKVNISGLSIGKGFTGYQKRHNFSRGPMTHGSKNHRQPGSIGAGTTPGRVFPGKRMAGRMGHNKVTVKNLQIIDINIDKHLVIVKGSVPGKPGNLISINYKQKTKND